MKARAFLKPQSKQSRIKQNHQSRLLSFIFSSQQIQQMHSSMQDNGLIVLPKLKNILFQQVLEDDQIIQLIHENPLGVVDKILVDVTEYFDKKVNQMIEPLQDQNRHLVEQLTELKQKLKYSMEDNQYFKYLIDKLEQDKKDVEQKLNHSESQIERNSLQCSFIVEENLKMKSSVHLRQDENQTLVAQNNQLKQNLAKFQKNIEKLQADIKQLNGKCYQLVASNRSIQSYQNQILEQNIKLKEQNELLLQRVNHKSQFISSFLTQYNKIHFFHHHDSFYDSQQKNNQQHNNSHELKGFSFNQYDKQSIIGSQHENNGCYDSEDTLHRISVTAEKYRPSIQVSPKCCQSDRKQIKNDSNQSKKTFEIQKQLTYNKEKIVKKFESSQKKNKIPKINSCKNFKILEGQVSLPNSEPPKLNLEETLKKKLKEKSGKCKWLEIQLNTLKAQFLQQLQRITVMEGQYQIKIDQLKQKNVYLNNEVNNIYKKFILVNSEKHTLEDKINQLEEVVMRKDQQHGNYCRQLKQKCKKYILQRIDEIEIYHNSIINQQIFYKDESIRSRERIQQNDVTFNLSLSSHSKKNENQNLNKPKISFKLNLNDQRMKQDSSDIDSYEHLSNHSVHIRGLTLDSPTNTFKTKDQREEICVRDNFEIESDFEEFAKGLNSPQKIKTQTRGNATDRPRNQFLKSSRSIPNQCRKISLERNLYEFIIQPKFKKLSRQQLNFEHISTKTKSYIISLQFSISLKYQKIQKINRLSFVNIQQLNFSLKKNKSLKMINSTINYEINIVTPTCKMELFSILYQQSTRSNFIDQYTQSQQFQLQKSLEKKKQKSNERIIVSSFQLDYKDNKQLSLRMSQKPPKLLNTPKKIYNEQNQQSYRQLVKQDHHCEVVENSNYEIYNSFNTSSCDSAFSRSQYQHQPVTQDFNIDPSQKLSNLSVTSNKFGFVNKTKQKTKVSSTLHILEKNSDLLTSGSKNLNNQRKYYLQSQKVGKQLNFDDSGSKSDLNKAMVWNSSSKKQLTERSESKVEKSLMKYSHIIQPVNPTPWTEQFQYSVSEGDSIPSQVLNQFFRQSLPLFQIFKKKYKLAITFQQFVKSEQFKLPKEKKKQLFIFKGKQDNEEKIFLMNNHRLFCLENQTSIQMDKSKYIYESNFMYGQSQVIVTKDGRLIISRQGKIGKLSGNIPDGQWHILSYISCYYRVKK